MRHLRPLTFDDLRLVASLHQKAFKDSALTKLGLEPVRRYYEWLLMGPHDSISIGIFNVQNKLLGFCFAGIYHGALSGYLAHNRKFLAFWLLTHPWLIFNAIIVDRIKIALRIFGKQTKRTPVSKNGDASQKQKSFGVLSIATDPSAQGVGIGRQLMDSVEQHAKIEGFAQLHLTVHPKNIQAVSFYLKCGWEKQYTAERWDGRMVKQLSI